MYNIAGNCHNTPLSIDVKELSITLGDLVSYEVGETYYNGGIYIFKIKKSNE